MVDDWLGLHAASLSLPARPYGALRLEGVQPLRQAPVG